MLSPHSNKLLKLVYTCEGFVRDTSGRMGMRKKPYSV